MSEDGRNSQKKAWKAFQANYDDVFALSDRLCSYCLTDQQVQAMLTMTEYLKWPTRWVSTGTEIIPQTILDFASQLEWRLMNGCCDDNLPIQWRYSSTGVLQQSMDGGQTWVDAPLYDPRVYSPQFPPVAGADGADKRCIAATGGAALLKEQIGDQLTDGMSRYTLGQLINDWVQTMLDTSNPFQALVTVVSNQIFALVISALIPALTDTVYDTFKCILYCHMNDAAFFDSAAWQLVRRDITDQIGGIAGIFLEHLVYLLGNGGITNLVRAGGSSTGDCSDCDCDYCYKWDFSMSNGNWYTNEHWPGGGAAGATYGGGSWNSAHPGGTAGTAATLYIVYNLPAMIHITDLIMTFSNGGMIHDAAEFTGGIAAGSPYVNHLNNNFTQIVLYAYDPPGGSMSMLSVEMHSNSPFPPGLTGGDVC